MGEVTTFKISAENDAYLMELYKKLGGSQKFNEIINAGEIELAIHDFGDVFNLTIHGFGDILITLLLNELSERG